MKKPMISVGGFGISFSGQVFAWAILVFLSLLFAQSLKMAVSHMIFLFVLLMPIGAIVQLVMACRFLQTAVRTEESTVEKRTPVGFSAIISNACIIPFPYVEAELMLPDEKGIGCAVKSFAMSLAPLSGCTVSRELSFSFRGEYSVGIKAISVCDCFRIIRLRIPCECCTELFVLPRKFELDPRPHTSDSELDTQQIIRQKGSDNTELSDIRSYLYGDSLKSIHWKLSSKSEELIVKDYSRNLGSSVCILCDLEPHFASPGDSPPPYTPLPEYAEIIDMLSTDLVVETCIASALRELRAGNNVTLMWFSDGVPTSVELHTLKDFEAVYRQFATAPLDPNDEQLSRLAAACRNMENTSLTFVTAYLDAACTAKFTAYAMLSGGVGTVPPELLYCADRSLFLESPESEKLQNDCIFELERTGFSVVSVVRDSGQP